MASAETTRRILYLLERRTFMALVSGGLLVAPLVSEAQRTGKVPRVGVLLTNSQTSDATHVDAFRQGLRERGYVEGQNIVTERPIQTARSPAST